jgi:hypothetical protein
VPIHIDVMANKLLGREFKRGRQEGEWLILRNLIEKRFGALPAWTPSFTDCARIGRTEHACTGRPEPGRAGQAPAG